MSGREEAERAYVEFVRELKEAERRGQCSDFGGFTKSMEMAERMRDRGGRFDTYDLKKAARYLRKGASCLPGIIFYD